MPLYTKTGDEGLTGLFGNERVAKDHVRIEAYGTVDELNSFLGLVRAEPLDGLMDSRIKSIQDTLFEIGADLATVGGCASIPRVERAIADLEQWIDGSEQELLPLRSFILPGGIRAAGLLHVVRSVSRRAERRFWTLAGQTESRVPRSIGIYLNRLSDLFFSWARLANHRANVQDIPWERAPAQQA